MRPKISIITVCFNSEAHIEEALLSVINQPYDNKEYLVIDGGSTDRTLSIIEKYLKSASNLNGNLNCSKELEHYSS